MASLSRSGAPRISNFAHLLAGAGGRRASQCLIDHVENRAQRQLIEAAAITFEMAFATELLARQARQRILYHPDITAVLDRAGMIPRLGEAADRPRSDQAGAGRTVKRDGRAAAPGGEMGHGGIGADIDGGTLEQGCQARPVETPAHADYHRVSRAPKAIDIGLLGSLAPFGRDHGEPARRKSAGEPAPAGVGPTLVAIERIGMQDGVWRARGELSGGAILRTDDIRH